MHTLDTNAVIYYLGDEPAAVAFLRPLLASSRPLYVSTITEIELFSFGIIGYREVKLINDFLITVEIIPVDSRIARIAGDIRRTYRLKLPDATIAATALATGSTLVTRNVKDFKKVPELLLKKV